MNQSLVWPGFFLFVIAVGIYKAEQKKLDSDAVVDMTRSAESIGWTQISGDPVKSNDQKDAQELEDDLLDGWPVLTRTSLMSRAGPRQRLYASITSPRNVRTVGPHYSLKTLHVTANRNRHSFPMIVDHSNDRVMVFAGQTWHDYRKWRPAAIERFSKLSGLAIRSRSRRESRNVQVNNMGEDMMSLGMGMDMDMGLSELPYLQPGKK